MQEFNETCCETPKTQAAPSPEGTVGKRWITRPSSDKITLQKYIDASGKENEDILEYAYLNSLYSTGIKNLVDRNIVSVKKTYNKEDVIEYIDISSIDKEKHILTSVVSL